MRIERATPINEFLAKLIFLVLPTVVLGYFLLQYLNEYYSILRNRALMQTVWLAVGMAGASVFYAFRFRFVPTFVLLLLVLFSAYEGVDRYTGSEFDAFFVARQFQISAILFVLGWVLGWGFVRVRYWAVLMAMIVASAAIVVIAKGNNETVDKLVLTFAPAALYGVYVVFTAEQIYNYKDKRGRFWWFLTRRLSVFLLLSSLSLIGIIYWQRDEIKDTIAQYGGQGQQGKNSMLKKNKDNSFDLEDYARLSSTLGRSNELLFCAHIDNFFPGTDIPNPLYLTAFYYTRFDTATETFERDSLIPFNDLFEPKPASIPLFKTQTDSTVIKNSLGDQLRQTVEVEIYSKTLSPNTYLAPNVGYFVQPITIEKDFRDQFSFAFRAKSYVSALNSAYFVYNVENPEIRKFQEMRFDVLRKVLNYEGVDKGFMSYYTRMPNNPKFGSISTLAHAITDTAQTPVDKVLAIRNYFLSKDENGQRLYQYTDNPGIPDLPNASKLMYFLNENHKGYCAYFAGATLFMLRSLGIPSRIAVGFLTEERSDKNKGWYWYYANQAHAWIQVYFPGYGWLDFDTTVGNDSENRSTPQPDGTPPMQPPKAWLAAEGVIVDVDSMKKTMRMGLKQFVYHDQEYKLAKADTVTLDMKVAVVYRDSIAMPLGKVQSGEEGTIVSYSEALKKIVPGPQDNGAAIMKRLPVPVPVDEVYLKRKDTKTELKQAAATKEQGELNYKKILLEAALLLVLLLKIVFSMPRFLLWYYAGRRKMAGSKQAQAYWTYRLCSYWLHMVGYERGALTPLNYAHSVVDPKLGLGFERFIALYLKQKYASVPLTESELAQLVYYWPKMHELAKAKVSVWERVMSFSKPLRCVAFFVMPQNEVQNDSE